MNERQSRISLDKIILIIGLIIYGAGFSMLYIIFAPLSRSIGLSTNQFGILLAVSNVALVFSSFYWGKKSQSIGRKPVFIIGLFSYALAYALFAFGIQLGLWGLFATWQLFSILFVIRLIYGGLIGGIQPAAVAYISDSTEGEHRTQGMALIGMSSGIGTMIGPAVGGALAFVHPLFPLYFGAALAIIGGLLAMKFLIEPNQRLQTRPVQIHNLKFYDKRIMPYLIGWAVAFWYLPGHRS
jgi:MFS family permease